MHRDAAQEKLEELLDTLHRLESRPLPEEILVKLRAANQYLGELVQDFHLDQEQSRLGALYNVSRLLGTSLDLDEVLAQVMDAVIGLAGAERGFLVLLEADSKEWRLRAARNFGQETLYQKDMEVSRTAIDTVIQNEMGLITTDAQTDPRFIGRNSVFLYSLRSVMCAPLLSRGRVIGAIYVDNRAQKSLFTNRDLELLNTFAVQAAIAIENARLFTNTDQALTRRVAELETLAKVDRELNSRLDYDHVLKTAKDWVALVGNTDRVWLLLTQEDDEDEVELLAYPHEYSGQGIELVWRVISQAKSFGYTPEDGLLHQLAIPILHSGRSLGAILIEREEPYSEVDVQFLEHLSSRAAAAIANARLYQAVQRANQAKSKFVSVVTHELRVPMTSIKGYADLLQQGVVGPVNEQQLNFINVIRKSVERMSALVSDLADISRIETGYFKLDRALVAMEDSIQEALRSLQPKFDEKHQILELHIAPDLPKVYADHNRLIQILTNLLSNAWKYSPSESVIRVTARSLNESVCVEVIDSGVGISLEDQEKLFTQFFRSENSIVREEPGWGLGLNVAKRLVEIMGGEIGFKSALGEGSTFWFAIPTNEANADPAEECI